MSGDSSPALTELLSGVTRGTSYPQPGTSGRHHLSRIERLDDAPLRVLALGELQLTQKGRFRPVNLRRAFGQRVGNLLRQTPGQHRSNRRHPKVHVLDIARVEQVDLLGIGRDPIIILPLVRNAVADQELVIRSRVRHTQDRNDVSRQLIEILPDFARRVDQLRQLIRHPRKRPGVTFQNEKPDLVPNSIESLGLGRVFGIGLDSPCAKTL